MHYWLGMARKGPTAKARNIAWANAMELARHADGWTVVLVGLKGDRKALLEIVGRGHRGGLRARRHYKSRTVGAIRGLLDF